MTVYPFDRNMQNNNDVLRFFGDAVAYREIHKSQSADIAEHVFDLCHPELMLTFPISKRIDDLRSEFGALEAPGSPDDNNKDVEKHIDDLWARLGMLIDKEKRTV